MNVSVIIPVLNEHSALLKLLPSLLETDQEHHIELIVCDGGSSDLTCPYIRKLQSNNKSIKLIEGKLGRALQMNEGALHATFDCLLFLHADTQLPKAWIQLIENKSWGRFDVRLSGQHPMLRVIETMMNWRSCFTQVATGDQAIFVQRSLFEKVGGFPGISLMEDIALSKKLRKLGRIHCIKTPLITSSRRWEKHGVFKTIGLMWQLRLAYFLGVNPEQLVKQYYPKQRKARIHSLVQVFSKLPILGYVKTRLIPQFGAQAATNIHRHLLKHTLRVVEKSQLKSELWLAQEGQLGNADEYSQFTRFDQQGDSLGDRMAFAIQQGLLAHQKVILIGTDCLDFTETHLKQSLAELETVDVVLTPVEDGGFISIACRVFDPKLFSNVAWGTETALAGVLNNIKLLSLSYTLLETVRDIDTYQDVIDYPELMKLTQ